MSCLSSTDQHDYENVPEKKGPMCADAEEDGDYLNVKEINFQSKFTFFVSCDQEFVLGGVSHRKLRSCY